MRPLAARLDTSDRMLLYYFGTRDNLIAAVLEVIGQQLQDMLTAGLPAERLPPGALLTKVWKTLTDPTADDALRLYLEVDVLASRGVQPYARIADQVSTSWRAWLADRIDATVHRRSAAAAAVLAIVDGLLIQRLSADPRAADSAARWIAKALT